ncbi:MAG: hypothetical protein JSV48_14060 [Bradyrhizobium sp.]|jgi:hypothetical protein|nr:MAG: hypothetical protein JSV48_14060 [Bradyrhizobium sp.]
MDDTKKPKAGLKGIDPRSDAERMKAHLKLLDNLASGAKGTEECEPSRPPRPDDTSSD